MIPRGVAWAKNRLEKCHNEHESCVIVEDKRLPKRTLHFQRLANGEISVRLTELNNKSGRYMALSHCWGLTPSCTLTSDNLKKHRKNILWDELPITFRDAIAFTLELDIHHIWIDALCIIQGNDRDWEIESSKMADVYQNAFLTLAATTSSDGNGGCFSLEHNYVREFDLGLYLSVRDKLDHWETPSTKKSAESYPLLSRGWVLQERYLSRKMLHFCKQELVWECMEQLICECGGIHASCNPLERSLLNRDREQDIAQTTPSLVIEEITSTKVPVLSDQDSTMRDQDGDSYANHDIYMIEGTDKTDDRVPNELPPGHEETMEKMKTLSVEAEVTDLATAAKAGQKNVPAATEGALLLDGEEESIALNQGGRLHCKWRQLKTRLRVSLSGKDPVVLTARRSTGTGCTSFKQISVQWRDIVEQFSALALSRETDRLPALSGLAMRASAQFGRYLCGLWFQTLRLDLLWRIPLLHSGSRRPIQYTGPTWSWASVNGGIQYWHDLLDVNHHFDDPEQDRMEIRRLHHDAEHLGSRLERNRAKLALRQRLAGKRSLLRKAQGFLFDCDVVLAGDNPFGEVISGRLHIVSQIQRVTLQYVYNNKHSDHVQEPDEPRSYWDYKHSTSGQKQHDPLHYQISVPVHPEANGIDLELPFFADYDLSTGPHTVPDGTGILLLLLYPEVCLVLRQMERAGDVERIGIIRQTSTFVSLYGLNWMSDSTEQTVTIV